MVPGYNTVVCEERQVFLLSLLCKNSHFSHQIQWLCLSVCCQRHLIYLVIVALAFPPPQESWVCAADYFSATYLLFLCDFHLSYHFFCVCLLFNLLSIFVFFRIH
jgi:hypothetical protein